MIIPLFFYAKCDPTYQRKVLDELEKKFSAIQEMPGDELTDKKAYRITDVIDTYADRYLIPIEYWKKWNDYHFLEDLNTKPWDEKKAKDHFIIEDGVDVAFDSDDPYYYLMNAYHRSEEPILDFPHDDIDQMFSEYTNNDMTHHPSKKLLDKYERMSKLYAEIKAAEDDSEKWFNLLLGIKIDKFLRINVEYRLGKNLLNKQLWKLYIGYLKNVDPQAMLTVYSKYVRFFMDDKEMLQEYKLQMEEHGHEEQFWLNAFEFEEEEEDETPFNPQICATFFNNINRQKAFSLPRIYINYFLDNAPPAILQKLFKCGKYFFARKPTPICYRLRIYSDETVFNDECVKLNIADKNLLENTYISTTFQYFCSGTNQSTDTLRNSTSSLIPHLFQCDAKSIHLEYQNLSFKDLKFLIGSGNCVELNLHDCEIKNENGEYVELEKIMEFLPKIKDLELPTVKVSSNTAHALCAQKFDGKISRIKIKKIIGKPFDAEEFKHFIVARRRTDFVRVYLCFDKTFEAGFVATLKQILEEYKKTCDSANFIVEIE